MATFRGQFEDASGNRYYSESAAQDVKMSDNTTAQDKITSIDGKYTALQTSVTNLTAQFQAMLGDNT